MSTLQLTFSDLYTRVSDYLSLGLSPTGNDLTKVKDLVNRGYRMFLYPAHPETGERHVWSWLKRLYSFDTISGQWKYATPSDFGGIIGNIYYETDTAYRELEKVTAQKILDKRGEVLVSSWPRMYAVVPTPHDPTVGQLWDIWTYETPNEVKTLFYWYEIEPVKLENDTDLPIGGVQGTEALLECCLAKAETQEEDKAGHHSQLADKALKELILRDRIDVPDFIGTLSRPEKIHRQYLSAITNPYSS